MSEEITEHALVYAGGMKLVRPNDRAVDAIYPTDDWIAAQVRMGATVVQRKIIVVSDWEEVTQP